MFYGIHVFKKNLKTNYIRNIMVKFTLLSKLSLVVFIFNLMSRPVICPS